MLQHAVLPLDLVSVRFVGSDSFLACGQSNGDKSECHLFSNSSQVINEEEEDADPNNVIGNAIHLVDKKNVEGTCVGMVF